MHLDKESKRKDCYINVNVCNEKILIKVFRSGPRAVEFSAYGGND